MPELCRYLEAGALQISSLICGLSSVPTLSHVQWKCNASSNNRGVLSSLIGITSETDLPNDLDVPSRSLIPNVSSMGLPITLASRRFSSMANDSETICGIIFWVTTFSVNLIGANSSDGVSKLNKAVRSSSVNSLSYILNSSSCIS